MTDDYIVPLWIVFAIFSAAIARSRARSAMGWFFVGIVFGPFGLTVGLMPQHARWFCPYCREPVNLEATICPHCRSSVRTPEELEKRKRTPEEQSAWETRRREGLNEYAGQAAFWLFSSINFYAFYAGWWPDVEVLVSWWPVLWFAIGSFAAGLWNLVSWWFGWHDPDWPR